MNRRQVPKQRRRAVVRWTEWWCMIQWPVIAPPTAPRPALVTGTQVKRPAPIVKQREGRKEIVCPDETNTRAASVGEGRH